MDSCINLESISDLKIVISREQYCIRQGFVAKVDLGISFVNGSETIVGNGALDIM